MSKKIWLIISIAWVVVFVAMAIMIFADNKAEVIIMILSGGAAVYAVNAFRKAKIKELDVT